MSGFDAAWLALREPADRRARGATQSRRLGAWLRDRVGGDGARIVDLGCGTGSNLRALSPHLPLPQRWTLVDHDPALLALASAGAARDVEIATLPLDLAVAAGDALALAAHVFTASALHDLVSHDWLQRVVAAAARRRAALLFALGYDGRMTFLPAHPEDAWVREQFAAHQRRDKGFGPALGPACSAVLAAFAIASSYDVDVQTSDWWLDSRVAADAALLAPLLAGIAAAAAEQLPEGGSRVGAWRAAHEAALAARTLRACIGHQDVLALPQ